MVTANRPAAGQPGLTQSRMSSLAASASHGTSGRDRYRSSAGAPDPARCLCQVAPLSGPRAAAGPGNQSLKTLRASGGPPAGPSALRLGLEVRMV